MIQQYSFKKPYLKAPNCQQTDTKTSMKAMFHSAQFKSIIKWLQTNQYISLSYKEPLIS